MLLTLQPLRRLQMEVIEAEKAGVDDKLSHIADLGERPA